jgi:RNA polymerase sigma-70 factor (ECF subfamily)
MKYTTMTSAISRPLARPAARFAKNRAFSGDSDEDIIRAVRDGDIDVFGMLVKRYEDFVYTLIRGMVQSEELAKDISQETFLRAFRGIRRFELRSSFKTWLYRIAHNTALSQLKRKETKACHQTGFITEPSIDIRDRQSLRLTLEKLIGRLKPELRAVIIFHYYDDLKYEEIAEILDCPTGTVKIRLYRAKHELKKLWKRYAV